MVSRRVILISLIGILLPAWGLTSVRGQAYIWPPPPPVVTWPPAPPVIATPQIAAPLSPDQINQLVAPIALYPDPLLAQLLPASTYPAEIAQAAQWLATYPYPSEIMIDMQAWDPSVKAMLHYPSVLYNMNANLPWTEALGVAFLNQQQDVMQAIQNLRAQALASGALQTNAQQQVILQNGSIYIEPVSPQLIYVPQYDPDAVYAPAPSGVSVVITFGGGLIIGDWLNSGCDWDHHWVNRGGGWRHRWRRKYILRRDEQRRRIQIQNFNRDRDRRRPSATWNRPTPRAVFAHSTPWVRNPQRPMPALPSSMVKRMPLQQYRGWNVPAQPHGTPVRPAYHPTVRTWHAPVARQTFGTYRGNVRVQQEANRGRQSMSRYHRPPVRQSPPAFRGMNNGQYQRQASNRGRASMRSSHRPAARPNRNESPAGPKRNHK